MKTRISGMAAVSLVLLCGIGTVFPFTAQQQTGTLPAFPRYNTGSPAETVRLVFIHHSCGENWLSDENGGLGITLRDNNYFVSDTNYGWGPEDADAGFDTIGDHTDIGNWHSWFRGPNSSAYLSELYAVSEQNAGYSRLDDAPGGENEIIMFKSCYPNSNLQGNPADPVPPITENPLRGQDAYSEYHTVANAKGIYIDLLEYFKIRQDKLFIVITAPAVSDPAYGANARALNNWLVNEWLDRYPYKNVFVFDFYNVLTTNGGTPLANDLGMSDGNHHRWWNEAVQHKTDGDHDANADITEYATGFSDDHPNRQGNLKATGEFVPLLNIAYNRWKEDGGSTTTTTEATGTTSTVPDDGDGGEPGDPCVVEKIYGSGSDTAQRLRQYRDEVMSRAAQGRAAIGLYYDVISPFAQKACSILR